MKTRVKNGKLEYSTDGGKTWSKTHPSQSSNTQPTQPASRQVSLRRLLIGRNQAEKGNSSSSSTSNKPGTSGKPKIDYSKYNVDSEAPKGPNLIKPAKNQPAPTPERGSRQETTTTRPPAQPARTEPKPQAKPQTKQSSNMDDNYAAWVKANRKLAEKVKPGQAGYDSIQKALGKSSGNNDSMKIDKPASKSGSATTASSNTRFTADEEKRGSAAFNQDSVKRLPSKETAEQRRRRMARQGMA